VDIDYDIRLGDYYASYAQQNTEYDPGSATTESMVQSSSCEADSHSANEDIPCLLCTPSLHRLSLEPVLSQMNQFNEPLCSLTSI
jgi:hypothetical protein